MNVKDRAKHRAESTQERAARQQQKQTAEVRAATLVHKKVLQQQRLSTESPQKRAARLNQQRRKLDTESPEVRGLRLNKMSALQQQRLVDESPEVRAARLERKRP